MRVAFVVQVFDDKNSLLANERQEIEAGFDNLRHNIKWSSVGYEIAIAALDKAQATAAGMVCPDATN